jgi:hypothetical protein
MSAIPKLRFNLYAVPYIVFQNSQYSHDCMDELRWTSWELLLTIILQQRPYQLSSKSSVFIAEAFFFQQVKMFSPKIRIYQGAALNQALKLMDPQRKAVRLAR